MFSFDDWFEKFWAFYPKDLCNNTKGPKPIAKQAAKRKVKTQKEADRIMLNAEARIRYDKYAISQKIFVSNWPHVRKYFTQQYYDQEIPSYTQAETAQEAIVKTCIHCTNPVHGPSYDVCTDHITVVKIDHEPRVEGDSRVRLNTLREILKS